MLENIIFNRDHYSTNLKLIYTDCEIIKQEPEWIYIKVDKRVQDDFSQIKRDITPKKTTITDKIIALIINCLFCFSLSFFLRSWTHKFFGFLNSFNSLLFSETSSKTLLITRVNHC